MSDPTPGNALVSGIQDISAFLPIVGTDQCERHVGEALTGGFLYAAATPLSIFGCLGIVKAGATILCASFSPRLAQMLADAGFNLEGSIAAMIGKELHRSLPDPESTFNKVPRKVQRVSSQNDDFGNDQFVAATKFLKLLEYQHISKEQVILEFDYSSWNLWLAISTFGLSCLSMTPYTEDPNCHEFHGDRPRRYTRELHEKRAMNFMTIP
ncbi:hypothetical protein FB45DRAFT_798377 [Roridomyces roridus]|uniref:Uncharacterized protein n=1 Tax=Roridomyces roridus TaxID=1738132 RepID=A0AAD7BIH9_9AGAR|nr:hypothetical protein FB45DRAFT_798377 [Roridomyces roridus]